MLEEKIQKDYVDAMKAQDKIKSSTLSFLRAQMKNVRIEKKAEKLEDPDVIIVIKKQMKQRQDSIEQYQNCGRQDLADKETQELNHLKNYLPEEMSDSEIQAIVGAAIKEAGASSIKDMGSVMKVVTAKIQGRADNKKVSEFVKKGLTTL